VKRAFMTSGMATEAASIDHAATQIFRRAS
jgi:hypothetical protein